MSKHNIQTWKRCAAKWPSIDLFVYIAARKTLTIVKNNKDIKSLNVFGNTFLYTAYADGTTFFLKKLDLIKELLSKVSLSSSFSALKPNLTKCRVAGVGYLKGLKVATFGIKCIDLTNDATKVLGNLFSYNKNIELEQNFKRAISGIEKV